MLFLLGIFDVMLMVIFQDLRKYHIDFCESYMIITVGLVGLYQRNLLFREKERKRVLT